MRKENGVECGAKEDGEVGTGASISGVCRLRSRLNADQFCKSNQDFARVQDTLASLVYIWAH
jgi:hypothetical protein